MIDTILLMCPDIDECAEGSDNCNQLCVDTSPGFMCDCNNGFMLDTDNKTCVGEKLLVEI